MIRISRLLAAAGLVLVPVAAHAQSVEGRLFEAETGEPIAEAEVALRRADGRVAGTARTDARGRFTIRLRAAGEYELAATAAGYLAAEAVAVSIQEGETVAVQLSLSRRVIPLAPVLVTGRRRDARHDASWEGAVARRDLFGRFGSRRVLMRGDIELRAALAVADVLRMYPPPLRSAIPTSIFGSLQTRPSILDEPGLGATSRAPAGCYIVYWNGGLVRTTEEAAFLLSTASANVEAVEAYRTLNDAPHGFRDVPSYVRGSPTACGVVALWPRRSTDIVPAARNGRSWPRIGIVAGFGLMMFVIAPAL